MNKVYYTNLMCLRHVKTTVFIVPQASHCFLQQSQYWAFASGGDNDGGMSGELLSIASFSISCVLHLF